VRRVKVYNEKGMPVAREPGFRTGYINNLQMKLKRSGSFYRASMQDGDPDMRGEKK
jgi:hypothetical protein